MKYYICNKLSKNGKLHVSDEFLDVSTLDDSFFRKLSSLDEVELYGGDGTINNFINKCYEYPKISVVKSGTGNDLARNLSNDFQQVAIFSANGYKYLNGFDVGFGALVCKLVETDKSKNKFSYLKNVYLGLKQTKLLDAQITIDDEVLNVKNTFLVAVQNSKYFGGGMKITPDANVHKQEVEVCIINNANRVMIAAIFPTVFMGLHNKVRKYVTIKTGKDVKIKLSEPFIAECDGEVQSATDTFVIKHEGFVSLRVK